MSRETDQQIKILVDQLRQYRSEIDRLQMHMDDLKHDLRSLLEERGENWRDEIGYARLVSEGERTSYDTAALDSLIINDPLRYGWLKDYRQTSTISSRIQVK